MKNWRTIEAAIVDHVHRRGRGVVIDECGRKHIAAEFLDPNDGRLLEQQLVIDVEALSRAIADNI